MTPKRKFVFFLIAPLFLMVGGAAAFFYVISNFTDPEVTNDINSHFAAIENNSQITHNAEPFNAPNSHNPEFILLSTQSNHSNEKKIKRKTAPKKKNTVLKKKTEAQTVKSHNGISKIASGTFLIEEKTIEDARSNFKKYIGSTVALLAEDETGPIGFKLARIKKNSYLHTIGLRNNDIIIAINGHALTNIEKVTLAIASFKYSTQFRLDILRKQNKHSLYYRIVTH